MITSSPAAAAPEATAPVSTGPNRSPAQAVSTEPSTAPRLRTSANVRAPPICAPCSRMRFGSSVPSPYQAKRVARVAAANRMLMVRWGGRSRDPKPGPCTCAAAAAARCSGPGSAGITFRATGTSTTRARTGKTNIHRQPSQPSQSAGITGMPVRAASEPPIGTPDIMSVAMAERHRGGMKSAARALAEGTRPPRPSPATRRSSAKTHSSGATAHATVARENTTVHQTTVFFRPSPSESRPAKTAPIIMPRNAEEPTVPAVAWDIPHSSMREGLTVPKTMRS
jgi:hypothetical protein